MKTNRPTLNTRTLGRPIASSIVAAGAAAGIGATRPTIRVGGTATVSTGPKGVYGEGFDQYIFGWEGGDK